MHNNMQGQFVIIAALIIALMIISLTVVMFGTVTYYRHESWEEYISIVDNIKTSSKQLLQIELANFTKNFYENGQVDRSSLYNTHEKFAADLRRAFPGYGLDVKLVDGSTLVKDRNIYDFIQCYWNHNESLSAIYAEMWLNSSKFGLYNYNTSILLYLYTRVDNMSISCKSTYDKKNNITTISKFVVNINVTVLREDDIPIVDLEDATHFQIKVDSTFPNWTITEVNPNVTQLSAGEYNLVAQLPDIEFTGSIQAPQYAWLQIVVHDTRKIYAETLTDSIEIKVE